MCVTNAAAHLYGTTILSSTANHPVTGKPIYVLGYENVVVNRAEGPNAMLLHFPGAGMTKENVVDTTAFPTVLASLRARAIDANTDHRMRSRGMSKSAPVEIFRHGIYTVILTADASAIPEALEQVPVDCRPQINEDLYHWYGKKFPGWSFALCCFNNKDAARATPLLWWYEPIEGELPFIPMLDAHTGSVPNLRSEVYRDHYIVTGGREPGPGLHPMTYRENLSPFAAAILPTYIDGKAVLGRFPNHDLMVRPGEKESSLDWRQVA